MYWIALSRSWTLDHNSAGVKGTNEVWQTISRVERFHVNDLFFDSRFVVNERCNDRVADKKKSARKELSRLDFFLRLFRSAVKLLLRARVPRVRTCPAIINNDLWSSVIRVILTRPCLRMSCPIDSWIRSWLRFMAHLVYGRGRREIFIPPGFPGNVTTRVGTSTASTEREDAITASVRRRNRFAVIEIIRNCFTITLLVSLIVQFSPNLKVLDCPFDVDRTSVI
jgi:hypothetical protein